MSKKIIVLFILIIGISAIFFYVKNFSSQTSSPNNPSIEKKETRKRTLKEAKIIGWTAYWDEKSTLDALINVMPNLDSFSPILYRIEPDGSLGDLHVLYKKNFLDLARQYNKPIIPVVGDDFDFERVSLLLHTPSLQEKFFQSLVDEAKKFGFVGWDVDIESLKKEDKEAFTRFIQKASEVLHKNGLELNVVVFARTGNDNNPATLAQDYKALGAATDEIRIMMYEAHNVETEPGGQAPLSWMREVLEYTTKRVPKEKIVVGLSTHGYDWSSEGVEPLTYSLVEKRIKEASASVTFDQEVSSAITYYQRSGRKHIIWFEDAQAITQKIQIILNEFDIDKFAIWRIGAEDPKIWEELKKP